VFCAGLKPLLSIRPGELFRFNPASPELEAGIKLVFDRLFHKLTIQPEFNTKKHKGKSCKSRSGAKMKDSPQGLSREKY